MPGARHIEDWEPKERRDGSAEDYEGDIPAYSVTRHPPWDLHDIAEEVVEGAKPPHLGRARAKLDGVYGHVGINDSSTEVGGHLTQIKGSR